jgi:uncharacterized damage-inducible protein DinB
LSNGSSFDFKESQMTHEYFYQYLTKARRALWASLRSLSDEELSKAVIPTDGARCIKDLVFHIIMVENGWFRGDLLGQPLVMDMMGTEPMSEDAYWHHQDESLDGLLAYWEAVEQDTLTRWAALMELVVAKHRVVAYDNKPELTITADEVLWHVMQHEVRHTAQIVQMIRLLGHKPPSLDLVFFAAPDDSS